MNSPKISVVMPNYNCGRFLSEAIQSILNQTFSDFEFIIIDDGSTDESWEIIQKFARKDARIVARRNEKNLKICQTLNKGIALAQGKYIARMDSDDLAMPDWLEKVLGFMEKKENSKVGVCGTFCFVINEKGKKIGEKEFPLKDFAIRESFWQRNPIQHSTSIIRKKCFDELGNYNEEFIYAEDLELWMRFGQKYKLANLSEFLVKYRVSGRNSIFNNQKMMIKNTLKARKKAVLEYGHSMNFQGKFFYGVTWLAQFLPAKLVFWGFNLLKK